MKLDAKISKTLLLDSMSKILKLNDLVPINLHAEREKFFDSGFQYNPQFIYQKNFSKKELSKYGKPKLWYLFLAKRIINKYLKEEQTNTTNYDRESSLNQTNIQSLIEDRMDFYGLKNNYEIVFSDRFISRISINNKRKQIKVKLPIKINKNEIEPILSHEIDTHVLRQLNYKQQPWFEKKKIHGFKPYLRTEEGLATINELIASKYKLAYKSAVNYLAVDLALKKDFVTVFDFLHRIWKDPEKAWSSTLRKKRGVTDTSKKGAYTKDLVYFEGFIQVLYYLKRNNCNPSDLYYGKINLKDIKKIKKLGVSNKIILPKIFSKNPKEYAQNIQKLFKNNLF